MQIENVSSRTEYFENVFKIDIASVVDDSEKATVINMINAFVIL